MKKVIIIITMFVSLITYAQVNNEEQRIQEIREKLEKLAENIPGLYEKVNLDVNQTRLPVFIASLGRETDVNMVVDNQLNDKMLTYNLPDARLIDFILYLCKEFNLTVDITGNIIALKNRPATTPPPKVYTPREIPVSYDAQNNLFSIELKQDTLSVAFKKITDITGKNLVYSPEIANKRISGYIKNKPFYSAMEKLAFSNNLEVIKTKDDYYLFQGDGTDVVVTTNPSRNSNPRRGTQPQQQPVAKRPKRFRKSNFYFKVLDSISKKLEVDFENVAIENVIEDIGKDLNIDSYTNIPLNNIGTVSMKASEVYYDDLLSKMLEDTDYTYRKKDGIYFFGKGDQKSLKTTEIIPMMHRSIEIMNQPVSNSRNSVFSSSFTGRSGTGGLNSLNNSNFNNGSNGQSLGQRGTSRNFSQQRSGSIGQRGSSQSSNLESLKEGAILSLFPDYLQSSKGGGNLDIKTDVEQNSFIVTGDPEDVRKFKNFIKKIDKPVPVILIEVMILEVNKSNTLTAGVELGVGDKPTASTGALFPSANVTLGANAINRLIGGFNGFGALNVGRVVPNFYAKIQAMESNGNVKIKSTPKLSTLNGHRATLSSGVTSYYAVTQSNVLGVQNPQTQVIRNYLPIDANLSISIRPIVSGDEQITLGISVVQSSFNGERIEPEAPPGINSREFTSTVRVKNQDVVILGGLEENVKNDSGSGVPFLARIPIIKWLFSKRVRTARKSKLSVLIRPTVIK
ncbi:type II secretion system protein GspD [Tenacibaculum amylolyticum]|uniref:type II secretion system protein GspD n=1 Tax=Tenacibaculum amylolyticum TaxID=104269 RepID=UPI003893C7B9